MASQRSILKTPYSGYLRPPTPPEDTELTHVERGSPAGELLRRYWQPVALSSEVSSLPLYVRMFGEDLVVFRTTAGEIGILDRHCSHRGASLEYGIPTDTGIRCCYHGWLFAVDGRILETPGDPPTSKLKDRLCHPAYPAYEYNGLIFGYFGPPKTKPTFPVYDSFEISGDKLVPYYVEYPCNWLQVHENVMDPAHAVFLHTRITFSHFADAWGQLPNMEFVETPSGMIYITTRRWGDNIWVRSNDIIMPNIAQVGGIWEDGQIPKEFSRVGITRWTTPIDNTHCRIMGWRHFHPDIDPNNIGRQENCGPGMVDFFGQACDRPYGERQRLPGDYDAQVSQRPIAIRDLEHLTVCDKGVVLLRRLLRAEIRKVADGEAPQLSPIISKNTIPTYCHDTVVKLPPTNDTDDDDLIAQIGRDITKIVVKGEYHSHDDRIDQVRVKIRHLTKSFDVKVAQ